MRVRKTLTLFVLVLVAREASGDVNLRMRTPSHLVTTGGTQLDLPPGYFEDEPTHDKLDTEVKRLQTAETRLTAENKSMKQSLATWQPGWITLAGTLLVGLATGFYLERKL